MEKLHEVQLKKNKMSLNNRKMNIIHPPPLYTSLFPQDVINDIHSLNLNTIHKSIRVALNVRPNKLIFLHSVESQGDTVIT